MRVSRLRWLTPTRSRLALFGTADEERGFEPYLRRARGAACVCILVAPLALGIAVAAAPAAAADLSLLTGAGVQRFTDGFAWQLSASAPDVENLRAHYTRWEDNSAVAAAYDLRFGRFNVSPGAGFVSHESADIAQRFVAHVEFGWQLTPYLRCQLTHFSSPGHDNGENLALCGIRVSIGVGAQ